MHSPRLLPRLVFALACTLCSSPARAAELKGEGANGDFKADAPGVRHRIEVGDLPKPYASPEAKNKPSVISRPDGAQLRVPRGFKVELYADKFENPRHLTTAPNGDIFVTESKPGLIRVLRDVNGDGKPDQNEIFLDGGLNKPFGLAFYPPGPHPQYIYIGNTDGIVRVAYQDGDLHARSKPQPIAELPTGGQLTGGGHWTRDVMFSQDGKQLFASVGSSSNVAEEGDKVDLQRACIYVMDPEGGGKKFYATGIRNPVGLAVHPKTGDLWTSVNERDGIGDDLVPDYITKVKESGFYGWPWMYLGDHKDPREIPLPRPDKMPSAIVPDVLLQSHSASLNLTFYDGESFPKEYLHHAFAAFHGSWNRETRTGYKVVRVPVEDGQAKGEYEDFLTGFVLPNGEVWGRPVGLCVAKDGALLVSEDGNNTIWRVSAVSP